MARLAEDPGRTAPRARSAGLAPAWGRALAYGWFAQTLLNANPPRLDDARAAAARSLELEPGFWFVREVLQPRLRAGAPIGS